MDFQQFLISCSIFIKTTANLPNLLQIITNKIRSVSLGSIQQTKAVALSVQTEITCFLNKMEDTNISEYERIRTANIERNEKFLRSVGLDSTANSMRSEVQNQLSRQATARGVSKKRKWTESAPTRRSGRVTVERLRIELEDMDENDPERVKKLADYTAMLETKAEGSYTAIIEAEESERYSRIADLELSATIPVNRPEDEGEAWGLKILKSLAISTSPSSKKKSAQIKSEKITTNNSNISKLKVVEDDVAKCTESRCTSVFWHPNQHTLICAAGDKAGNFGIWNIDSKEMGVDGVFKYKPHVSNICKIWSHVESQNNIMTASYDGTIRVLDVQKGKNAFILAHTSPEGMDEMYYTDVAESSSSTSLLYVSKSDATLACIDLRQSATNYSWSHSALMNLDNSKQLVDAGKFNSVQVNPQDSNQLIAAGLRGAICLYDVRKAAGKGSSLAPIATLTGHSKTINAAYCSPNGEFIVSVGQDNTVRTWSDWAGGAAKVHVTKHDNHTGRWLSTFRPSWDPKHPSTLALGSMERPRRVEVWTAGMESGRPSLRLVDSISSDALGSVCSRNAFHPTLDIIAASNSSGRVHICR